MDKLPPSEKFFDISDYSRPFSHLLVRKIKNSNISPIHFTTLSLLCGISASIYIYFGKFPFFPAFLILLKSFFDAVDGELARARNRPSFVGRFYDSVVDFIVNILIFLALSLRFEIDAVKFFLVVILFHLQGSVYNYYYVLKRHKAGGDKTSNINEKKITSIYPYDNRFWFKIFHTLYVWIYSWQDYLIYKLDKDATELKNVPNSFMSLVSLLGLGTQLLIIALMLVFSLEIYIIDFFIYVYTILALIILFLRKMAYKQID